MRRAETSWAIAIVAIGALIVACFGAKSARVAEAPGFPLDDAWIHVRFAQNLAQSGCFAFNPGEPTAGSTSPLWVIVLAGVSLASGGFVITAVYLGVLFYLLWGLCTYLAARRMFDAVGPAILAALVVLVNVRVVWAALSGMEIPLAGMLAMAAAASFAADEARRSSVLPSVVPANAGGHVNGPSDSESSKKSLGVADWRALATPALFGLASLARPEAHLLFCWAVFLRIARSCRRDTPIREIIRLVPYRMIAVYLLIVLPWHLFCLWSSGSLLPNTFRANFRGLASRIFPTGFYSYYARWLFVRDHPWIYWLMPLGVLATIRWTFWPARQNPSDKQPSPYLLALAQLSVLWAISYPAAARTILPMTRHYLRYMIPMTSFHAILAVVGLWALMQMLVSLMSRWSLEGRENGTTMPVPDGQTTGGEPPFKKQLSAKRQWAETALWIAISLAVVLSAAPGLGRWATLHGRNVYSINHQHVAMAEWVKANTPPDAVIATHDIGALGAISGRRIVDLFGLVTPKMIHRVNTIIPTLETSPVWYLRQIKESGATYLIGYPHWLPFVRALPGCFEEIHREVLDSVDITAGADLVAYQIHRERLEEIPSRP